VKIGLRITVATARGARDGVPRLIELLGRHSASGTFYFNLGPARFHHWLPGRSVGTRAAAALRSVRDAGHELGLYGWDPARWRHLAGRDGERWVEMAMRRGCEAFERLAGEPPRTHAAPYWRTARRALRLTQQLGFDFASDVRGSGPFMPVCDAELVLCPQLPTTLPTFDELVGSAGTTAETVHERILAAGEPPSGSAPETGHVFALPAESGAARHAPGFERLLEGWRARGHEVMSMRELFNSLDLRRLPRCALDLGAAPRNGGAPATQGGPFLA
jgi:peptidoglycan/xylan/chitin deacetylase (PgdA/CDA1 family)